MKPRFKKASNFLSHIASFTRLTWQAFFWTFCEPFRRKAYTYKEVAFQMDRVGLQSFPIISLVCFLIGMILVLQTAYVAETFGQLDLVPGGVAVSLTREIGPLLVAIVVTGRVGAAYSAELGAQLVSDEVTALKCMAIDPIGWLVAPRLLALLIMLPILTVYGNLMGILGGYVLGTTKYDLSHAVYWDSTFNFMQNKDIYSGMIKSVVFALIIAMVGCYKGLTVRGGPNGVGQATMEAVVISIVLIIASDAFFTALLMQYWP